MQSISDNDNGTYALHMVPLTAGMLGLTCQPCLGPHRQLIAGDYKFRICNFGVHLLSIMHLMRCPPCLMWIFLLDLSGSCPGGAKSRFTASESWYITPNYYPPSSDYE